MTYAQQLETSDWQRRRYDYLVLHPACAECGETTMLNVHHLRYRRGKLAWEHADEDLITLCRPCHHRVHMAALAATDATNGLVTVAEQIALMKLLRVPGRKDTEIQRAVRVNQLCALAAEQERERKRRQA